MKIIKTIIILTFLTYSLAHGQQKNQSVTYIQATDLKHPERTKGSNLHISDSSFNKFLGKWIWNNGDKSIIITINKETQHLGGKNNVLDVEMLAGRYQYLINGKEVSDASDNFKGSSSGVNTVNLFIDFKYRKTSIALLVKYLNANSIQVELDKNRFEFKNDKNFELKSAIILTRQE